MNTLCAPSGSKLKMNLLFFFLGLVALPFIAATSGITIRNDENGYLIATKSTDKIGFHGKAPVALRTNSAQTALTDSTGGSTANATLAAVTAPSALTDNTTGSASTTLASISDSATKNAVASLAARQAENRAAIVALTDAAAKEAKLLNELRAALVEKGLIKGS